MEAASVCASCGPCAASTAGVGTMGLTEPSSPKNGIGRGRSCATFSSARPPRKEPVKATAAICGAWTSRTPTSMPAPSTMPRTPAGRPCCCTTPCASFMTSRESPGWPGCALTTTVQPAASAAAVSPPSTENANGKLLALNIATGPSGTRTRARRGRPAGGAPATASSSVKAKASPCSALSAKPRSWNAVRSSSPFRRPGPSPVSPSASGTSRSRAPSSASARPRSSRARVAPLLVAQAGAASAAWRAAASICSGVLSWGVVISNLIAGCGCWTRACGSNGLKSGS